MKELARDVSALGGACWDYLGIVERLPELDEKTPIHSLSAQGGGRAATAAAAVGRLGGTAAVFNRIGDDEFGRHIREGLEADGVDTTWLISVPGTRSHFAFCVVDKPSGKRTIFYEYGTAGTFSEDELDYDALLDCRCFLTDSHHDWTSVAAARRAREAGVPVVLDIERPKPCNEHLLAAATHPIIPRDYALTVTGTDSVEAAGMEMLRGGAQVAVITLGAEGAVAFAGDGETIHEPALDVGPIVDTTGAGDVFHGAFALGIARGYDLRENLRFSSAVAGLKCRKLGGRAGIPTMDEVREFLG
ncbi:MAG: PfkB family carbohydrate kinase [Armatimonadota bacterium]|jgi:sulfofructose kinase